MHSSERLRTQVQLYAFTPTPMPRPPRPPLRGLGLAGFMAAMLVEWVVSSSILDKLKSGWS